MKRRTKAQKIKDYFDAFKCIKEDRKVEREGTKDGSIATHPVVEVRCSYPEKDIIHDCLVWLRKHGVFCSRHDCGTFQNIHGQWGSYGIRGAGDIIGLLKTGQHIELEIKRGKGGRLSLIQQKRMQNIKDSNGVYLIIHGIEELEYYLLKQCSKCKEKKLISNFYSHKFTKDKLHSWCKDCIGSATHSWRQTIKGCLHDKFNSMKQRCNDLSFPGYKYWGGRGIKIMFKDANEFIDYVINKLQVDPRGLEIHRIDNNGNYEKGNIEFITPTKHREI